MSFLLLVGARGCPVPFLALCLVVGVVICLPAFSVVFLSLWALCVSVVQAVSTLGYYG